MMRSFALIGIAATFSLTLPATVGACQGPRTYDFARPGAYSNTPINAYWYFIGGVVSVEPEKDSTTGVRAKVNFEVLRDYRYENRAAAITAFVRSTRCVSLPRVGAIGKFAIDEHDGKLILADTPALFYPVAP